ncbi:MAG: hypothetical protein KF718_33810 [Polyangiaceae bacterium]|nr:hypothetical protein [Polyangiaceae bacterium]
MPRAARTTPRALLQRFDAYRRGPYVLARGRTRLERYALETQPSFEDAGMDDEIEFVATETSGTVGTSVTCDASKSPRRPCLSYPGFRESPACVC